jgi:hypothetical protein
MVRIHNDMVGMLDRGHTGELMLLDLSAAWDEVLYQVFSHRFRVTHPAHDWI